MSSFGVKILCAPSIYYYSFIYSFWLYNVYNYKEPRAYRTSSIEEGKRVHPYPGLTYNKSENGQFAVILFSATKGLEALAQKNTHHLYFRLLPCGQTNHGYELWDGDVYFTENKDQPIKTRLESDERKYKLYIPLDINRITHYVNGYGALDGNAYIKNARGKKLCVQIGGAKMWGESSMFSNKIDVPILIDENSIKMVNSNDSE